MLISIVTPCYNSVQTIRSTFNSVLAQSECDYEYIIVDGGSTDGTLDIIKEYELLFAGKLRWISEPDNGIYDAVRKGFAMSEGDILAWLGADDVYMPNAFANVKKIFESYPQVEWLTGEKCHIKDDGTYCNAKPTPKFKYRDFCLKEGFWVQQESTFWRKGLWQKCETAFGNYRYAGDYALWLCFSRHTHLYTIPLLLAAFHLRDGQVSETHKKEYMAEIDDICNKELLSMPHKERFILQLYSRLRGKTLVGRLANYLVHRWDLEHRGDKEKKNFYFNYTTKEFELR